MSDKMLAEVTVNNIQPPVRGTYQTYNLPETKSKYQDANKKKQKPNQRDANMRPRSKQPNDRIDQEISPQNTQNQRPNMLKTLKTFMLNKLSGYSDKTSSPELRLKKGNQFKVKDAVFEQESYPKIKLAKNNDKNMPSFPNFPQVVNIYKPKQKQKNRETAISSDQSKLILQTTSIDNIE